MKMIYFEGYLNLHKSEQEELEDRLLNVITSNFDEELETMSCEIVDVEE